MIHTKTNCENCLAKNVCKVKETVKITKNKIFNHYKDSDIMDYIDVDVNCKYFIVDEKSIGKLKKEYVFRTSNDKEKYDIGSRIHMQLAGNEDYISNNIILNIDEENTIRLSIFEGCKNIPEIVLYPEDWQKCI